MRETIGKLLRWLIHEHKWETPTRLITYRQYQKDGEWVDSEWTWVKWFQRCECGAQQTKTFTST